MYNVFGEVTITLAHEMFSRSEVEEKRQLIKLVLQNLTLDGEKLVWEARKPFDLMLDATACKLWRPLVDTFLNYSITFDFGLDRIKGVFEGLNIAKL